MTSRILLLTGIAGLSLGLTGSAHAGFTAVSNPFTIANGDADNSGNATIGDTFTVNNGSFLSFLGDTSADPTISGGDLANYKFDLTGAVSSVAGNVANYTGTYSIYYDLDLNGAPNEGIFVSQGTFSLAATFAAANTAALTGSLVQTAGPSGPGSSNFRDLGATYGNNPVTVTGTYMGDPTNPLTATGSITLRQNASPVPEPASMAALSLGALALVRKRRRAR